MQKEKLDILRRYKNAKERDHEKMEELKKEKLTEEEIRLRRNKYQKEYNRVNRIRISLNFDKEKDKDVIKAIEEEDPENKQKAVKAIIRRAIERDGLISLLR